MFKGSTIIIHFLIVKLYLGW